MPIIKRYSDGDALVGSCITMSPHYDDVSVRLYIFSGGSLFAENDNAGDGTTEIVLETDDFDTNGQMNYYIESPPSE